MEYQYIILSDKLYHFFGTNYSSTINCHHSEGVTFIRGLPGVGKTELAIKLAHFFSPDRLEVVELDQQFWHDGKYEYCVERLDEAFEANLQKLNKMSLLGPVVVSDTILDAVVFKRYLDALPKGVPYNLITLLGDSDTDLSDKFQEHYKLMLDIREQSK